MCKLISSLGVNILNITLSETSALAICKYIKENIPIDTIRKGYHFNALVNGTDFFSGHIYTDGGSTWWGTVQQRGSSSDTSTMYKYFGTAGADSVTPFSNNKTKMACSISTQYIDDSNCKMAYCFVNSDGTCIAERRAHTNAYINNGLLTTSYGSKTWYCTLNKQAYVNNTLRDAGYSWSWRYNHDPVTIILEA